LFVQNTIVCIKSLLILILTYSVIKFDFFNEKNDNSKKEYYNKETMREKGEGLEIKGLFSKIQI